MIRLLNKKYLAIRDFCHRLCPLFVRNLFKEVFDQSYLPWDPSNDIQYVLAKMVNHFSSFRSQKALRKTHFFENPFLRIWARVENSWENPIFEQHFHKKQRFVKIARISLVKINHFLVLSLETQKKTHFFENPFLRNRARVEKSREFSKNPFYRKPIFARTYCKHFIFETRGWRELRNPRFVFPRTQHGKFRCGSELVTHIQILVIREPPVVTILLQNFLD